MEKIEETYLPHRDYDHNSYLEAGAFGNVRPTSMQARSITLIIR